MVFMRLLPHALFVLALPLIVSIFGLSLISALLLVLLALVWRLAITVAGLLKPPEIAELELETIGISHYSEKVRWCLDRLGVEYQETQCAGIIGILSKGRTVPQLKFRTGMVQSRIGNSAEILRYLWGRYASELGYKAAFLAPRPDRVKLESELDKYGRELQIWAYYHILPERSLALTAWGVKQPGVPRWQKTLVIVLFPLLRAFIMKAFRITSARQQAAVERIEQLLADMDERLAKNNTSLLNEKTIDYVDITFAALSSVWARPFNFGAGKCDEVRIPGDKMPIRARADIDRWSDNYPHVVSFIETLYREERRQK